MLLTFLLVVRPLGEWARPAAQALDCDHVAAGDLGALERCQRERPDDVEVMANLGQRYETAGQWDRAEEMYRAATAIDPEDGDLRLRLASVLLRRGNVAAARREASIALTLQPGRSAAIELLRQASSGHAALSEREP
jgi:Flp pilus assembly protein TadD